MEKSLEGLELDEDESPYDGSSASSDTFDESQDDLGLEVDTKMQLEQLKTTTIPARINPFLNPKNVKMPHNSRFLTAEPAEYLQACTEYLLCEFWATFQSVLYDFYIIRFFFFLPPYLLG
jgi:hypothetical protein